MTANILLRSNGRNTGTCPHYIVVAHDDRSRPVNDVMGRDSCDPGREAFKRLA